MSLYADYLRERTDDGIIETASGFATYRILNEGKSVYIVDIYVVPSERRNGRAADIAAHIIEAAKELGATELLGTVVPSTHGSTESLKVLLAYGMKIHKAEQNLIILRKDI